MNCWFLVGKGQCGYTHLCTHLSCKLRNAIGFQNSSNEGWVNRFSHLRGIIAHCSEVLGVQKACLIPSKDIRRWIIASNVFLLTAVVAKVTSLFTSSPPKALISSEYSDRLSLLSSLNRYATALFWQKPSAMM